MEFFDRLLTLLDDDSSEEESTTDDTEMDPAEKTGDASSSQTVEDSPSVDRGAPIGELLDVLEEPSARVTRSVVDELIDQAGAEPDAFAEAIPDLLARIRANGEAPGWVVAAPLATLATTEPERLVPHAGELINLLGEDERADEHLGTAIVTLAQLRSVPVEGLCTTIESEPISAKREATIALGAIATSRPNDLPVERLQRLYREDDVAVSGCAGYVLAVLASECPDAVAVPAPTPEAVVNLSVTTKEAGLEWVSNSLTREAIPLVAEKATGIRFNDVEVAATPAGTQLVLFADEKTIDDPKVKNREITEALKARLELNDPRVEIRKI